MRKKALLAGAVSSFEGPWVNLESGEWLVEPSKDVQILRSEDLSGLWIEGKLLGPARIRAVVSPDYDGPGIFLSAKQVSNGDSS